MRLTAFQIQSIKDSVASIDSDARIFLFGSRADAGKRGGDIDLLIESPKIDFGLKRQIRQQILQKIGEQKIDIVISKDLTKENDPFILLAFEHGILL